MIDVESYIYTRMLDSFSSNVKSKFNMTDDNFSTLGMNNTDAIFPFVYIHVLPSMEQDNTLENDTIESMLCTVRISVKDNEDSERVTRVMNECIKIMKSMRFTVVSIPEFDYSDRSVVQKIGQFRRVISADDIL